MSTKTRSRGARTKGQRQVFISYARPDVKLAEQLASELKKEGFVPWLDVEEVQPGENALRAMGEAIEAADAIVVLISKAFLRSPHRRQEWDFAIGSKKHAGRVLPVLTPGTPLDTAPWILKHIQHIKSGSNWEKTSQRVAQTLHQVDKAASYAAPAIELAQRGFPFACERRSSLGTSGSVGLRVVTNALTKPRQRVWSREEFKVRFSTQPIQYVAELKR